jgi:alanyl-tRNA synthetase
VPTKRLYYTDPYLTDFDATVVSASTEGGRSRVTLDRTAFYPTSGGQPFDTGLLNGQPVVDVIDTDEGAILHVVDGDIGPGEMVRGAVDWPRRFDHMQQHTGQHVLSAAFERVCQARTTSFHLGADSASIDLHIEVKPDGLRDAAAEANRIVWENRPVRIRIASPEEAARLPLRKEPAREGPLRLIDVEDFDLSACGGTHVAFTGSIGIIAIAAWERFKGGQRVEFLCGRRALGLVERQRDLLAASTRLLSVGSPELPAAIERLQNEGKEQRRAGKVLQERLAAHEAAALVARGERAGAATLIVESLDAYDANGLKALASAIAAAGGTAAVLIGAAAPYAIVVARAADVPIDAAAVLKPLLTRFGGKGGGRPDVAQGGGLSGSMADILAAAREALQGCYHPKP